MSTQKPTVEEARAWIHQDLDRWFGEEYDNLSESLDTLVAAVRREAAEEIRTKAYADWSDDDGYGRAVDAADLIDSEVTA